MGPSKISFVGPKMLKIFLALTFSLLAADAAKNVVSDGDLGKKFLIWSMYNKT